MSPGQKMLRSGEQGIDMVLLNFLLRSIDFQNLKNHERNKVLEITRTATYVPALVVLWHNFFWQGENQHNHINSEMGSSLLHPYDFYNFITL